MSIFDFLKPKSGADKPANAGQGSNVYREFLHKIYEEVMAKKPQYGMPNFSILESYQELKKQDAEFTKAFLVESIYAHDQISIDYKSSYYSSPEFAQLSTLHNLYSLILRQAISYSEEELYELITLFIAKISNRYRSEVPIKQLLTKVEDNIGKNGLTEWNVKCLNALLTGDHYAKENEKIKLLLNRDKQEVPVNTHDVLGEHILRFVPQHTQEPARWNKLILHLSDTGGKSQPTEKWNKAAKELLKDIPEKEYLQFCFSCLEVAKEHIKEIHELAEYRYDFLRDSNHDLLKALIWTTPYYNNTELNIALDDYAQWAYKKLTGVGSISVKTGNACMYAFTMLPLKEGASKLSKFKNKIKNNTILKTIDKFIEQTAGKHGVSNDELEEMALPEFGMTVPGHYEYQVGEYTAQYIFLDPDKAQLQWSKDGKLTKAVPAPVKTEHPHELKKVKNDIKELESLFPSLKRRLEKIYLRNKSWSYEDWELYYFNHPVMAVLTHKLLWIFEIEGKKTIGFYHDGKFIDKDQLAIEGVQQATVSLWHPIYSPAEDTLQWRRFLQDQQLVQPYKQAFREIYIITDAEVNTDTYSNRFAAHILRQHQFSALCKQRDWRYNLMGAWDSHNTPTVNIPEYNLTAQFYIDSDWQSETNDSGIFNYVSTDQVCFLKERERIQLLDVPAIVFSEIMRDVDLYVGVCSIGNDPNWRDGGHAQEMDTYWHEYSFRDLTESAKIRLDVLMQLVPRLKIAALCSFDKKFLIVKGKLRTYKIHIGSGNIMMEPNDEYLCIVPARNSEASKVFLPFEGDNLLSIIISKAFLLAEDDKITDSSITRQINKNS